MPAAAYAERPPPPPPQFPGLEDWGPALPTAAPRAAAPSFGSSSLGEWPLGLAQGSVGFSSRGWKTGAPHCPPPHRAQQRLASGRLAWVSGHWAWRRVRLGSVGDEPSLQSNGSGGVCTGLVCVFSGLCVLDARVFGWKRNEARDGTFPRQMHHAVSDTNSQW
jgi:hypothetical protein